MAVGDRPNRRCVDNPAMRRFRAGRAGVAAVAVIVVAGIAIALTASQAQGRNDEQTTFQLRADIASRFVATYVSQLASRERRAATEQLGGTPPSQTGFELVDEAFGFPAGVLLDDRGDLMAIDPPNPALIGSNLASRYPHLAAAETGHATVSDVTLSAALHIPVVAFATPFTASDGTRRVYSGAYEIAETPLADYLSNAIPYAGHQGYLIDASGNIVTSNPVLSESAIHTLKSADPSLAAAIATSNYGIIDSSQQTYFAMQPIAGTPWRVVVSVPTASLYSALDGFTFWVPWVVYALFSIGIAVGLLLMFRYLDGRERLDRLSVDLDRLARVDSLTELYNRRHLDEQLTVLLSVARRRQEPLSVLLIDVDHFKGVNDTAGHAGGDRALKQVACRLRSVVRTEDLVGRWGGEEFLVLLPNTGTAAALVLAERLRSAVAATPVNLGSTSVLLTISIGVATGITIAEDALVRSADDAMYESKRLGRNRVSVTGEPLAVAG